MQPIILITGQTNAGKTYVSKLIANSLKSNNWEHLEFLSSDVSALKAHQGRTPLIVGLKSFVAEHLFATNHISLDTPISSFRALWQQNLDSAYAAHGMDYFIVGFVYRVQQLLLDNPNSVVIVPDLHFAKELTFISRHFAVTKVIVFAKDRSEIARDEEFDFDLGRIISYRPHPSETDFECYFEDKALALKDGWVWLDNDLDNETRKSFAEFKQLFPDAEQPVEAKLEDIEKEINEQHSLYFFVFE